MKLYEGTSGFSYTAWKGSFYPEKLPQKRMLEFYAGELGAVEINNTFYRMPKTELLEGWRARVPEGFRFVLKVPQRISHRQRLVDCADDVDYLVRTSEALGEARGPFLIQLPPFLKVDVERLRSFLGIWPAAARVAFEFRHPSWFDESVLAVLRDAGAALCIAESGTEIDAPFEATASFGYLRLRREDYSDDDVAAWARRAAETDWDEVYVFFKHEDEGAGPRLARRFRRAFDGA